MTVEAKRQQDNTGSVFHTFQTYLDEKLGTQRTEIEGIKTMSAEDRETLTRIQADLNAQSELLKKFAIASNAPNRSDADNERMESKSRSEAFNKALKFGIGRLNADERKHIALDVESGINTEYKAMFTGDATTGGFLATPEYVNQLLEFIVLTSDMPSIVSMRYTSKPWVMTPRLTQTATAVRVAEQATRSETQNPKFGLVQNFPYESYAFVLVSRTDLDDSELDLGTFLMKQFATQFAKLQGYEYLNGKGSASGESLGILNDAVINNGGVGHVTTAASGLIDYQALVKVKQSLKPPYWPKSTWTFTNETLGDIQMLTDNQNRPLWVPFGGTLPDTLFGRPYKIMPDMPQAIDNGGSAGALAIAVGSFEDAYEGVVRKQVSMQALYERYADQNAVGFFGYFRFGGTVKMQEAIKTLRIKP